MVLGFKHLLKDFHPSDENQGLGAPSNYWKYATLTF
jgi:hypothetical protein